MNSNKDAVSDFLALIQEQNLGHLGKQQKRAIRRSSSLRNNNAPPEMLFLKVPNSTVIRYFGMKVLLAPVFHDWLLS